ncbi:TAXI family TRAP transporter solute-binding subunit [Shouchella miscanthi]|uniref:TAXI family TRAP transporter solute-binding subunit n=1 Tax=Shouchella miscanthi TaxID=2598861 RepID=UPI001643D61A|nr:TAXI family TRAP transporter solute-binding subunit [Shouchella miscanthi]
MNRQLRGIVVAISLLIFVSACSKGEAKTYINVGTAATGGAYYPIGISMADIISSNSDSRSSAEVTGGALENVDLVDKGELEIAISQTALVYAGYHGDAPYQRENTNIRSMFGGLSKGVFHIVVSGNSDIYSVEDLKGKNIVLGPAGGGATNVVADIMSVYGLQLNDVNGTYVSYSEGVGMLSDHTTDAMIVQSAIPASAIVELAATVSNFRILSMENEMDELLDTFPYLEEIKIPSDLYGTDNDITTVNISNMVIVNAEVDEDTVYQMTRDFFSNIEMIQDSHPSARELSLESATNNLPIPLHPGAEKYFEESGLLN